MEFINLTPKQLQTRLAQNAQKIREVGDKKAMARLEMIVAEAELADKEARIYKEFCEALRPSRLTLEIKYASVEERKKYMKTKSYYMELQDEWDTIVEVNNALKAYIRVREQEWQNQQVPSN